MSRFFIVCGEASGELHASNLVKELKLRAPFAEFSGFGGKKIAAQGVDVVFDYEKIAFMGFKEVFLHLKTILSALKFCKTKLLEFKPDAVILFDYPGFNMRIAEFARKNGIIVIYYISPQIWAWKENRIKKIKRNIDLLICILPFEKKYYKKHNYEVQYFGHPLVKLIEAHKTDSDFIEKYKGKKVIAILPGSRKQELARMLAEMTKVVKYFSEYYFIVAASSNMDISCFEQVKLTTNIEIVFGKTYDVLSIAHAGIIKSGTSTLEAALFNLPMVVCYKTSAITYQLSKIFAKVKFISLVNLIANKPIVVELIQKNMNEISIKEELSKILNNENYRLNMLENYSKLKSELGNTEAYRSAAQYINEFLKKKFR